MAQTAFCIAAGVSPQRKSALLPLVWPQRRSNHRNCAACNVASIRALVVAIVALAICKLSLRTQISHSPRLSEAVTAPFY